jgi:DNA-binding transcriptional regulator YiaG
MDCDICNVPLRNTIQRTRQHPYHNKMYSIESLYLAGIETRECPRCSGEIPTIPRIKFLNDAMAHAIVRKRSTLRGGEVSFLRRYARISAKHFAIMLDILPKHLSDVESGKSPIGKSTERLVRVISLLSQKEKNPFDILKELIVKRNTFRQDPLRWLFEYDKKKRTWSLISETFTTAEP